MTLLSAIEFPNLFSGGITVNVGRVAFTLFGLEVYWYGIIITAAVVLGITYGTKFASRAGLMSDSILEIAIWGVLAGVVGARLYYVIFWNLNPDNIRKYDLIRALTGFRDGGLAVYGGVIGAVLVGYLVTKSKKMKFAPLADLIGLGFLIGHCVGRWGNFFNQEAFGAPTAGNLPWGMTGDIIRGAPEVIEKQSELGITAHALVHPCFLYESLWCLLGLIILHVYMKKFRTFDGEVFLLYVIWYGSGRAFIEALRTDSLMASGLKISQLLAIASAVIALVLFVYFKGKCTSKNGYVMYKDTEESRLFISEYQYKLKLDNEKEKAKNQLRETVRELTDPFSQPIIDEDAKDDDEDIEEKEDEDDGENY